MTESILDTTETPLPVLPGSLDPRARSRADGCHASPGHWESTWKEQAHPLSPSTSSATHDKKWAQVGKKKQPIVFRGTLFATILQFGFFKGFP